MSPWRSILLPAALSSSLTAALFLSYDAYKTSLPLPTSPPEPQSPNPPPQSRNPVSPHNDSRFDEDLIHEFLARNYAFFGPLPMQKVRRASVVIVGCGGVGSWGALMLLRRYIPPCSYPSPRLILTHSGVSHLRLIDFDLVTLSSLNRHACAVLADVGIPKVTACHQFFPRLAPWATIDPRIELWPANSQGHPLLQAPDCVIGV